MWGEFILLVTRLWKSERISWCTVCLEEGAFSVQQCDCRVIVHPERPTRQNVAHAAKFTLKKEMRHDRRRTNTWLSSITTICNYTATLLLLPFPVSGSGRLWLTVYMNVWQRVCVLTCDCPWAFNILCVGERPSGASESFKSSVTS